MAARQALKFITIPPRTAHKSTFGVSSNNAFVEAGNLLQKPSPQYSPVLNGFSLMHSHTTQPVIPVTFNYGATMPAWYDIKKLPYEEKELDVSDVWTSVSQISAIITSEAEAGLPENKIILGGFSQGCAMTLATGLTTERKLAGLICLSGRLLYETIKGSISEHSRNLPIFWGHGTADSMVTYSCGQNAVKILRELSFKNIDFKTYHGLQHGVDQDEIDDLQLPSFIISLALYAAGSDADTAMSVLPALKYIIVPPRAAHTSTIIFLHGLGDTGEGWKPDVEMLAPNFPGTKWILPHARIIPVTINMQMEMSAWFDIASLTDFDNEDEKGLLSGVQAINEIITAEVDAGTPANKIILGGKAAPSG
ncbi:hypothetical protein FRB96_000306 [Tulasnella sp. 330]|nr:hypothetical protein FRB96_000306 [Tulasnella sp. 330]